MSDKVLHDIGRKIKALRIENSFKQSDLASMSGITKGLVSKIENGRTVPSLPVLISILQSLKVNFHEFFSDIMFETGKNYFVIKPEDQTEIRKEDAYGFQYRFIFNKTISSGIFEVVLLTIEPNSRRDLVTTDAYEFKYILEGEVQYQLDEITLNLKKGDALFYDGRIPHVPRNIKNVPAQMLVIYIYSGKLEG
jgi:transcriptional regulator with XRE-family HTH domain